MYEQKVGSESRGDLWAAIQADNLGGSNTREEIPKLGMSRQTGPQRASQSSLAPEVDNGPMQSPESLQDQYHVPKRGMKAAERIVRHERCLL